MSTDTPATPRLRFAPSPTGFLHVGNVRTALINWLFAEANDGSFLLRIDDTDKERSTKAFETAIKDDLRWLGIDWTDSFNQSDRFAKYDAAAEKLKEAGLLYPCYETSEELEQMRKVARAQGKPPVYDRSALALTEAQKNAFEAEGRAPHWRFKLSGDRIEWNDLVRGRQTIDTMSLSDPILIRGNGSYLYTLPSVVDDIEYQITHIVRGEDHVTNSGAQLEIFEALGGEIPILAHTPLLIWKDGSALSKRLGSLGIGTLADRGIEPLAIASHLAKLGTSDSVSLAEDVSELISAFDFTKIGRSPARFDDEELHALSTQRVHAMPFAHATERLDRIDPRLNAEEIWQTIRENCSRVEDAAGFIDILFGDIAPVIEKPDDVAFLCSAMAHLPEGDITRDSWAAWTATLKGVTGRKGRALFMPLRQALTGLNHGPNMADLLPLLGRNLIVRRLNNLCRASVD